MDAALIDIAKAPVIYRAALLEMQFTTGTLRLAQCDQDVILPDNTIWKGAGGILSIGAMEQVNNESDPTTTIALSGLDQDIFQRLFDAQGEAIGQPAKIHVALQKASDAAMAFVGKYTAFNGYIDQISCSSTLESLENGTAFKRVNRITASIENIFRGNRKRSKALYYTSVDQKSLYPTDLGLEHIVVAADKMVNWPFNVVA